MASPMSADRLVQMLKAEGCKVVEVANWRTHNRNKVGAFGPVNGVMIHHTVSKGTQTTKEIIYNGYAELPGPLAHGMIGKDGVVYLCSAGRANHAGGGDPNVLQAVIDERYDTRPPAPHQHQGSAGAVDGNARFYGFECENLGNGTDPWPAVQVDAIVRASAAICRFFGWSAKSVIGHSEWSDWKNDPRGPGDTVSMPGLRGRIQERLNHAPGWNPSAPAPAPTTPKPGVTVTTPTPLVLSRPEDTQLLPDSPVTLYWTQEHLDPASQHGAGNRTVASNVTYTGTVTLAFENLDAGEGVEVYPVEENASGEIVGFGDAHRVVGNGGAGAILPQVSVPVTGRVGQRLAIQVVNRQETPVTLTFARLSLLTWPNA